MAVPFYIILKPVFYLLAIIVFWHAVERRSDGRWQFAAIISSLFVTAVALSFYEADRVIDGVVAVGSWYVPYLVVKAFLENVALFAIVGVLVMLLTKRLRTAEREARQLARIAANSADAIIGIDAGGTITSWNLGAQLVFGYFAQEVTGSKVDRLFGGQALGGFEEAVARCQAEGFVRGVFLQMSGKGGRPILAQLTLSAIGDEGGRPAGTSLFIRDTTEQKEMEEELLQASKMAAMGTMAAGIVHEFGNLLTVISGRAELGKTAASLDEAKAAFEAIYSCAGRAKSVTSNLLAYAKRQQPHKLQGQVSAAADAAVSLLEKELERARIIVARRYDPVPDTDFDREQITQVFVNLLLNALNAMRDNGGHVEISIAQKHGYIEAAVGDDGPGIPEDLIPKLFVPFSTAPGENGGSARTGLGLYVCREIVKFHSGNIAVESHRGGGATFRVYLPVTSAGHKPIGHSDTHIAEKGRCRVAVVDRDAMIRDLLAEALRRRGVRVYAFPDAASAEADHVAERFDLIFADISVKGKNGRRYVDELKNHKPVALVGIVGEAVEPEELKKIEEGLLRTLRKPFGLDEVNAICDLLSEPEPAPKPQAA